MARMSFWRMCSIAVAGAVTTLAIGVGADPAAAAIRCEGNYQVQDGNRFATPYCEDLNIVKVAREYGVRVSFDQIRYNPGKVEQVCRVIGDDLRVKDRCKNYMPDSGRDTFQ
jgi:hypothetical protein